MKHDEFLQKFDTAWKDSYDIFEKESNRSSLFDEKDIGKYEEVIIFTLLKSMDYTKALIQSTLMEFLDIDDD